MRRHSLLFICAANRCRSPLAMALLQRMVADLGQADHWRIESAGLHALPDLPVTMPVQTVAQEIGLDLSQHRSRPVDAVSLADYQLILTMEEVQAEALASAYPDQVAKIHPFSTIVNLHVDIEDPTGRGLPAHRALVALLQRYLQVGFPRLSQFITSA